MSDTNDSAHPSPFEKAKQTAAELKREAVDGLHHAQDALKKGVETSKDKINDAIDTTAERVDQAHMFLKDQARERPIAVTAAAIGAGVLLGLILANGRRR